MEQQKNHSSRDMLNKSIRAIGVGSAAQRAFTLYPSVESASLHLLDFFTDRYPGREEPLAHECLRSAFKALAVARKAGAAETQAFLVALVGEAGEATRKRVGVAGTAGERFWVPFEESFRVFLERAGKPIADTNLIILEEPAPGNIADHMASVMLAVRIMSAVDADRVCSAYLGPQAAESPEVATTA